MLQNSEVALRHSVDGQSDFTGHAQMTRLSTVLLALASVLVGFVAPVQAENVVRWATPIPADTFDPYGHDELFTIWVQNLVFESLTNYDWRGRLEPGLAVSWKRLDATTWEMELRQGVTFHDGTPFADVVFSIERAKAEASSQRAGVSGVAGVEAVDAYTLRFTAATVDPIPWENLWIAIMSKAWAERHDAQLPAQLGDGRWDYVETHANGTGPFMLEEFEPEKRTVLVRNPNWWGLAQHRHNIDRIVQTRVDDPARGAELLLAHDIDVLQSPPADQLERIAATPGLKVQKAVSTHTLYLGFDQASPELRSSNVKGRNPFADRRVRQAVYQGIDIGRIVEALHGLAVPAGMLIWPKGIGWSEELDRRLPFDPAKAKALLAEAGYPEGFGVRFDCPAYREPVCSTIGASLQEIGILVDVALQPPEEVGQKIQTRATDFFYWGYSEPFDSWSVFKNRYRSDAEFAGTGYADPEVDALIDQVEGQMVTYVRDALIEKVWRKVLGDVVYVPLYHTIYAWALRADLDLPISIMLSGFPEFRDAYYTSAPAQ
jgi:peptide/nickel transport system substrate-binding protein